MGATQSKKSAVMERINLAGVGCCVDPAQGASADPRQDACEQDRCAPSGILVTRAKPNAGSVSASGLTRGGPIVLSRVHLPPSGKPRRSQDV